MKEGIGDESSQACPVLPFGDSTDPVWTSDSGPAPLLQYCYYSSRGEKRDPFRPGFVRVVP